MAREFSLEKTRNIGTVSYTHLSHQQWDLVLKYQLLNSSYIN